MKYKPPRYKGISNRDLRRIAEREQKRQQNQQAMQAFWNLSPEERQRRIQDDATLSNIQRNGITIDDLDNAAQEGYRDGNKAGAENTMKICYAAIAIVLHAEYEYDTDMIMDFLNKVDNTVLYSLDSHEAVQQVWDEIGLQLSFSGDPLDERIAEKEE